MTRSFQYDWSYFPFLRHLPICRPALGNVGAGDHYFDWRPDGVNPIASVLFSILPSYDFPFQIIINPSTIFTGISCFIIGYEVPPFLPKEVYDTLCALAEGQKTDLQFFIDTLDTFIDHFHRPYSPHQPPPYYSPPTTSPLEL